MTDSYNKMNAKERREDRENSNAGMIAGIIIVAIGLVSFYLYYNSYYNVPLTTTTNTDRVATVPAARTNTTTAAPSTNMSTTPTANTATPPATTNTAPATSNNNL